jgi:hypothetical protein
MYTLNLAIRFSCECFLALSNALGTHNFLWTDFFSMTLKTILLRRVTGVDPREKDMQTKKRTFNMTIIYPPTLVGEYQFRLSEWAPALAPALLRPAHPALRSNPAFASLDDPAVAPPPTPPQFCPIYRIKAAQDPFGCEMPADSFQLPGHFDSLLESKGQAAAPSLEVSYAELLICNFSFQEIGFVSCIHFSFT